MNTTETLRQCRATLSLIDRADCKDDAVWQKVVDTQAEVDRVLRDGEKPFAYFVQQSSFGPFIECKPDQVGAFAAHRHQAPSLPAVGAVPEGFALVPTDVTDDMIVAFAEQWYSKRQVIDDPDMADAYKAMLYAAPQPAAAPSGDVERERDRYKALVAATQEAILKYYDALSARKHGTVAQHDAFSAIEYAFGMYWDPNVDHRAAITATKESK